MNALGHMLAAAYRYRPPETRELAALRAAFERDYHAELVAKGLRKPDA